MTRKQLVAEITTELKKYDESGLIDYISLNRWIKNELKIFGNNVMELTGTVLRVENGETILPENFFDLDFIVKCKPYAHKFEKGGKEHVQSSYFWTQRLEETYEWDNMSNSHRKTDFKMIEERVVLKDSIFKVRYNNPILLKPVRGIKRDYLTKTCKNLRVHDSPYEFNISGERLQFNFRDGDVYIQYYGIPLTEDGDFEIPDSRNIQEYLIAYCKRKILEIVWQNDDDTNMINKLQYIKAEENSLKGLAFTEVKFNKLGDGNWAKRLQRNNNLYIEKFERMFPV